MCDRQNESESGTRIDGDTASQEPNDVDIKAQASGDLRSYSDCGPDNIEERLIQANCRHNNINMECLQLVTVAINAITMLAVITAAVIYGCQLAEMRHSTDAALAAYAEAARANAIASANIRQQTRAYVGISYGVPGEGFSLAGNTFQIKIVNGGQTPAHNVTSSINWKAFTPGGIEWPPGTPFDERRGGGSNLNLVPGRDAPFSLVLGGINAVPFQTYREQADRKECTIFVYGSVKYKDIFGDPHATEFCVRYVSGGTLNVTEYHNESE
jgi:hypothetical protein